MTEEQQLAQAMRESMGMSSNSNRAQKTEEEIMFEQALKLS